MKITYSIVFAAIIVVLLYLGYLTFQTNTTILISKQHTIDSLSKEIYRIDSLHTKEDSLITVYKDSIIYIDNVIETEKIKYVNLKHKIDEIRTRVIHYTPTQLDSFFTSRYGESVLSSR